MLALEWRQGDVEVGYLLVLILPEFYWHWVSCSKYPGVPVTSCFPYSSLTWYSPIVANGTFARKERTGEPSSSSPLWCLRMQEFKGSR